MHSRENTVSSKNGAEKTFFSKSSFPSAYMEHLDLFFNAQNFKESQLLHHAVLSLDIARDLIRRDQVESLQN